MAAHEPGSDPWARGLTVEEWEGLEDPPSGRWEVLDGELVVTPSPDSAHNQIADGLAALLRVHAADDGGRYDVTTDVEWRTVAAHVVRQAPRPDIAIGVVDPQRLIFVAPGRPLVVVEVISSQERPAEVRAKREYYRRRGMVDYWEVRQGPPVEVLVFDLSASLDEPAGRAVGAERLELDWPFPVAIVPGELAGWVERHVAALRAEAEAARAEAGRERARAQAAEARLAELGEAGEPG
ncbi:MAG: Uma2 family endonuclease [Acidimicrobiales bacterium]